MYRTIRILAFLAALAIVVDLIGHRLPLRADDVYRVASVRIPERGRRAYRPGEVIVQFKEAVRDRDASDMMREAGGRTARRSDFGPRYLVRLDDGFEIADALDRLRTMPGVDFAEPNGVARAFQRVGYFVGHPELIAALEKIKDSYNVNGLGQVAALATLDDLPYYRANFRKIVATRQALSRDLAELGFEVFPSQANFILVDCGVLAPFLTAALAALGVVVRGFPNRPGLTSAIRITLPGDSAEFERLIDAFETVLSPEALLFDMDGVLADVQQSQRAAIAATASSFGALVTSAQVAAAIRSGDAANDWLVTQQLIEAAGCDVSLDDVTARYQSLYLSLRELECLIPSSALLERLAASRALAIVTGRPRAEAQWFLDRAGIASLFGTVVAMEDARPKPDPAPVRLALERLGVRRAWMIGDTPDDVRGARHAGVLPLGVVAPGDDPSLAGPALRDAGVAHVLDRLSDLLELLP